MEEGSRVRELERVRKDEMSGCRSRTVSEGRNNLQSMSTWSSLSGDGRVLVE